MKMTAAYMKETADWFVSRGFALEQRTTVLAPDDKERCAIATRYALSRHDVHLVLESVSHPSVADRFYLELVDVGVLRSPSFALDSWRFCEHTIELKYLADPELGMGHTIVLDLHSHPETQQA